MNELEEPEKGLYSEYLETECTECGTIITEDNNNGDGLCTKCMYNTLHDLC